MKLDALTLQQCEEVRQWRNENISSFRTSHLLTEEMQEDFYYNIVCNNKSNHRYYALVLEDNFVGMGGLTNISLENRNAEISLIIKPSLRRDHIGIKAVKHLLREGFMGLNLDNIYGECYDCNPHFDFWTEIMGMYEANGSTLFNRKYSEGRYFNSLWFNFDKNIYLDLIKKKHYNL